MKHFKSLSNCCILRKISDFSEINLNYLYAMIGLGVACSQHFAGLPGGRVNLQGLVPGGLGGGPYSHGVV